MGKKKKTRRDTAEIARSVVEQAIGEQLSGEPLPVEPQPNEPDMRNPGAVALSKLGASKGGEARTRNLTKKERIDIARNSANARRILKLSGGLWPLQQSMRGRED